MTCKQYIKNVLIAIDQLVNTLLKGEPDETMSSRVYRNWIKHGYWYCGAAVKILDCVFGLLGDEEHCKNSYENELNRTHLSEDML